MSASWADQNEIMSLGKAVLGTTGSLGPSQGSITSKLASYLGIGYDAARDLLVKSLLDRALHDKVHNSMELIINSNFRPEFVDPRSANVVSDDSLIISDPASSNPDGIQIPKRMFNIDTGNLEERANGQYVILSHSWKGSEILYQYITNARENRKQRQMQQEISGEATAFKDGTAVQSDTDLIGEQCDKDIDDQVEKIGKLWKVTFPNHPQADIRDLLFRMQTFKNAGWAEWGAKTSYEKKAKEEDLKALANKSLQQDKEALGVSTSKDAIADDTDVEDDADDTVATEKALEQFKVEFETKSELSARAKQECESVLPSNTALRNAVEDMLPMLERRKSVTKIKNSLVEAKRILDTRLFPSKDRRRYLWNDTCCINKLDAGELTESLAMMGQWYSNADLCLVHLDTPVQNEWVASWDERTGSAPKPDTYANFDLISKPKWATRGWTLQELVLAKMTFYVNALWEPLTRPVEGLGTYYFLMNYIDQYLVKKGVHERPSVAQSKVSNNPNLLRELLEENKISKISYKDTSEKSRILISILDFLGVDFEINMDDDTCGAYIRSAIVHAAFDVEKRLNQKDAPSSLENVLKALGCDIPPNRAQIINLIESLLRELVIDSKSDIDEDRENISRFAGVSPEECCRGLGRSTRAAHNIFWHASSRECTVAIDSAYSLMGVLGVKFTAFPAEGLTKALCRLLDEVVITSNDVSIFNWAGKDLGSPIRGRSLYPSDLSAFSPEISRSYFTAKKNQVLAKASKENRFRTQKTSRRLTSMLKSMIDFVKGETQLDAALQVIDKLLKIIQETPLDKIRRRQLETIGKILAFIENPTKYHTFRAESTPKTVKKAEHNGSAEAKPTGKSGLSAVAGFKAQLPQVSAPKLDIGGISGRFGRKKAPVEDIPKPSPAAPLPAPVTSQMVEEPDNVDHTGVTLDDTLHELNEWLVQKPELKTETSPEILQEIFSKTPPPDFEKIDIGPQKLVKESTASSTSMTCPNPIMLTTSGIEGVFDVQRVIITMKNPESLRYEAYSAVNDAQKITGECNISTALSTLMVNFQCSAGVLKPQLDVSDVVHRFLMGDDPTRLARMSSLLGKEKANYFNKLSSLSSGWMSPKPPVDRNPSQEPSITAVSGDTDLDVNKGSEEKDNLTFGDSEAQKKVLRMLSFVQETDLNLIAGEWVLARFSATPGAQWFLCQLQLGSTHNYYGRRIATDYIDFGSIQPEAGVQEDWTTFMALKKKELCNVVGMLVGSRAARKYAHEVVKEAKLKNSGEATELDDDSGAEDGAANSETLLSFVTRRGAAAGAAVGAEVMSMEMAQNAALAGAKMLQQATDQWGAKLTEQLDKTVLEKVPKELRAAISNLNENKELLPAMFLSGVRVHMF